MSWQVLHLHPRCEKKVAEHCPILGVIYYLPLRSETKIYQRRKVTVEKPVFPGYLFVSFDQEQRLGLLKTNHVIRFLTPTNEEQFLHELEQIRMALAADPTLSACTALKEGRRVRITGGPFLGVEGFVEAIRGPTKVRLNVDMIGQAVAIEVGPEYLEVID